MWIDDGSTTAILTANTKSMSESDSWSEEGLEAPEVIETCVVVQEFLPTTNDHLTLIRDSLVYVFSKDAAKSGKEGWWWGETKGVVGPFPSKNVKKATPEQMTKFS